VKLETKAEQSLCLMVVLCTCPVVISLMTKGTEQAFSHAIMFLVPQVLFIDAECDGSSIMNDIKCNHNTVY